MSNEQHMTIDERRKYLHRMRVRYWKAKNKKERSKLLDEMEEVTELHITSAVMERLGQMRLSTLGCILKRVGQVVPRLADHKQRPTQPNRLLRNVPMLRIAR